MWCGSLLASRGSGWVFWPGVSGGCPRGCPAWGPVSWFRVLWGSLPLGACRVQWSGVSWPPRVRWVPSSPVPLPSCRPPSRVPRPCPLPPLVPVPLPVWWPLLWPVVVWPLGCVVGCAVFSAVFPVGVAPSSRVGVPSCPCAGSSGWSARPGVVRAASGPCCGGAAWRVCAFGGCAVWTGAGAVLVRPLWRALPACATWCRPLHPLP